jgi:hypothetical protein
VEYSTRVSMLFGFLSIIFLLNDISNIKSVLQIENWMPRRNQQIWYWFHTLCKSWIPCCLLTFFQSSASIPPLLLLQKKIRVCRVSWAGPPVYAHIIYICNIVVHLLDGRRPRYNFPDIFFRFILQIFKWNLIWLFTMMSYRSSLSFVVIDQYLNRVVTLEFSWKFRPLPALPFVQICV